MKVSNIWYNYSFWFKVSLILMMFWLVFSLSFSLVVYFSWPYDVHGFEAIIFRFLSWFFILPALAILGIVNSIPFMIDWLFEDVSSEQSTSPHVSYTSHNNIVPQIQKKVQSYKDVSSRLADDKESHGKEALKTDEILTDFENYDDF